MEIAWSRVLPVVLSILIIIAVAIIREYSRPLAAITATMPINVPLALWIVFAAEGSDQTARIDFAEGLLIGIMPTLVFLLVTWLVVRAGWTLLPTLAVGYTGWGLGLLLIFGLRRLAGL